MDLFLDITLGAGLAFAAGLRPFLPALLAGALARAHLGIDFDHASYSFLASYPFLISLAAGWALSVGGERLLGSERFESGPLGAAVGGLALGVGALLFAATLSQHGDMGWPGLFAGIACAALAQTAARGVIGRARRRLADDPARHALPLYLEAVALALAAACVLAPPLSLLALVFLARLLLAARRREGERYAGLRILR
jgi:hypothetical protein